MSVLIRTIGNRQYAYLVRRSGGRTVQTYLGPTARADVAAKVAALREEGSIPSQFHRFFWDTDPAAIDLHQHATYIIARVLEIGNLRAVWWLQLQYPTSAILEVLASSKQLSARSRRFWSAWFGAVHPEAMSPEARALLLHLATLARYTPQKRPSY